MSNHTQGKFLPEMDNIVIEDLSNECLSSSVSSCTDNRTPGSMKTPKKQMSNVILGHMASYLKRKVSMEKKSNESRQKAVENAKMQEMRSKENLRIQAKRK